MIPTNITDHTELASPIWLSDQRRINNSYRISNYDSVDEAARRLQQQIEQLEVGAHESNDRAINFERRAEESERRTVAGDLQRVLTEVRESLQERTGKLQLAREQLRELEQCVQEQTRKVQLPREHASGYVECLAASYSPCAVRREGSGLALGRGEWAAVSGSEVRINRRGEESDGRAEESDRMIEELQRELAEVRESYQERTREVRLEREQHREYEQRLAASNTDWVVRKEEIEMTGPEIGRGGWATVIVATFRGVRVAAKTIHNQLISPYNIQLFRREVNMAARLRHPNLVQFIGATIEGSMIILTELMLTSLRAQLSEGNFAHDNVASVSLDVARALNYLHQMQPDPMIHRDISSGNVLLNPLPVHQWRAKLSDYGTVNILQQLHTVNPGSPVYAAPEANNPQLSSPKMDIYSFGVLILEMLTGRLPTPEDRPALLLQVHHHQLLNLIQRCLHERRQDRPTAATIIGELDQ